ncbi:hypothetical protein C1Y63_01585 [Corynebacterium sp. 13CS0277]|uniref:ABC transporter substrate-binding protein n=1 Tax=Corynebacterium sp. 13CS0277 TaxID=2071994 RepID=UPI000D02B48E|nr:ABC transporter substrate-binding protein [Corynebacterium sp. 13CS0277]PRQ12276.1 hypothetical protein C1Y63_01585 [Corynebacterium sp. 13CS0277]
MSSAVNRATTGRRSTRRRALPVAAVVLCVSLAAGCAARPGPAPVVDPGQMTRPARAEAEATPTPVPAPSRHIVVGIDQLHGGFNPHLAADDDTLTRTVARLVLPSAFYDGVLNRDLLKGAAVVPAAPGAAMTVRYVIAPTAQWSDGTPITGTDFAYLATQASTQPGVVDAAGYRAISEIRTSRGGKTVEVDFSTPVKDWTGLFANLLPSHLVRVLDAPFDQVLAETIPASGNLYQVTTVDRARGRVTLSRNDRFWGAATAGIETVDFVAVRATVEGSEMLRSGQLAAADLRPQETSAESYALVPGSQVRSYEQQARLDVDFSTTSDVLSSRDLRAAVASLIDVPLVARLAAGRTRDIQPAAPWPGLVTATGVPDVDAAAQADSTPGQPTTAVENLRAVTTNRKLVIAADAADTQAVAAALTIADVLAAAGVQAAPSFSDPASLRRALADGTVDAVVGWHRTTPTPLALASEFQCEQLTPRRMHADLPTEPRGAAGRTDASADTAEGGAGVDGAGAPAATPARELTDPQGAAGDDTIDPSESAVATDINTAETARTLRRTPSGFCDPQVDQVVADLLAGDVTLPQAQAQLSEVAGREVLSVPLFVERRLLVTSREIPGAPADVNEWPLLLPAGPLAGVASWGVTPAAPATTAPESTAPASTTPSQSS